MAKTTLLYILSPPYSGSTLLTYLLATRPEIGTIGERYQYFRKVFQKTHATGQAHQCSCGALFVNCPFWCSVKEQLEKRLPSRILQRDFTRFYYSSHDRLNWNVHKIWMHYALHGRVERILFPLKRRFKEQRQANEVLIDIILGATGASIFLDSSKDFRHLVYLSTSKTLDVRVIHLIRDGRGQVLSKRKRFGPAWNLSFERICQSWQEKIEQQRRVLAQWGGPQMHVGYEALCADPTGVMADIYRFAGLAPETVRLDFRSRQQHIMGNSEMRLSDAAEIRDRQAWRQELTSEQLATFEQVAGPFNRQLGYT